MTIRYCRACKGWHDLGEPWPVVCCGGSAASGIQIIKDIEPYQAVALDVASGKAPRIGSRSEHRDFMKRNGYVPVESAPKPRQTEYRDVSAREIRQTYEKLRDSR